VPPGYPDVVRPQVNPIKVALVGEHCMAQPLAAATLPGTLAFVSKHLCDGPSVVWIGPPTVHLRATESVRACLVW
jgi:hypothetical protein